MKDNIPCSRKEKMIDLNEVFGYDNGGGQPETAPIEAVEVIEAPRDLGDFVRRHGCYPPEGLAGWEWKPGERPGPPDPPVIAWEEGIPFSV